MFNFIFIIAWISLLPEESDRSKFIYFEVFLKNEMAFFQSHAPQKTVLKVKCYRIVLKGIDLHKGDLIFLSGNFINDKVVNCIWANEIKKILPS